MLFKFIFCVFIHFSQGSEPSEDLGTLIIEDSKVNFQYAHTQINKILLQRGTTN